MNRLYEAGAYAPRTGCWWDETVDQPHLPPLTGADRPDVAVIGAGYSGLSAAIELAKSGASVIVLEAEQPGFGASGRNGGFCCLGGGMLGWRQVARRFGHEQTAAWAQTQVAAVGHVDAFLKREGAAVDRHSQGETILAHSARAYDKMHAEAEAAHKHFGVEPTMIDQGALRDHGLGGTFFGGMTTPIGFALNPGKYMAALLAAAIRAGVRIFGNSPVQSLERSGSAWGVATPLGVATAEQVILATNGYSSEDLPPWMRSRTLPVQSSVLVTRPLTDDEMTRQGWTSDQMAYDSRFLLHYFRKLPDNRFLFGMRGGLRATPAATARIDRTIRRHFQRMFPKWAEVEPTHIWSGLVCLLSGAMPYCGPVPSLPGVHAVLGYHGNGVAMGSYLGACLGGWLAGTGQKDLLPEFLRSEPGRFPLGKWRRALMMPAYAAASVLDR